MASRNVCVLTGTGHSWGDPPRGSGVSDAAWWTLKWSDLIRNQSNDLGEQGMWAFHNWLSESFRENKPYDRFVRELIAPTPESAGFIRGIKWRGNVNASQVPEVQFAQNVAQVSLTTE